MLRRSPSPLLPKADHRRIPALTGESDSIRRGGRYLADVDSSIDRLTETDSLDLDAEDIREWAVKAINNSAASSDTDVPECVWFDQEELESVSIADLPVDGTVSLRLSGALGELPGNAEARIYGTRHNPSVIVVHDYLNDEKTWPLSSSSYIKFIARHVSNLCRSRDDIDLRYYSPQPDAEGISAVEYSVYPNVSGTLLDYGRNAYAMINAIESSACERLNQIRGNYDDLEIGDGRLVTDADIARVESAPTVHSKGKSLEDLVATLFVSLGGFQVIKRNYRTKTEEIDVVLKNVSNAPFWKHRSPFIEVECKNWSTPAPRAELDSLRAKVENRAGQCGIGVFVSWSGFTKDFDNELLRLTRENYVIVVMDGEGITEAVRTHSFGKYFEEQYFQATHR